MTGRFGKLYTDTLDLEVTEIVPEALIVQLNKALDYDYMEKVNTEFRLKYPRNSPASAPPCNNS